LIVEAVWPLPDRSATVQERRALNHPLFRSKNLDLLFVLMLLAL